MNQPEKKPRAAAAAVVAPAAKRPYTAVRHGKDGPVTDTGVQTFNGALDRRVTEGFNLIHGRLDELQTDVRENRRDLKELRKEVWVGLRDASEERAQLASRLATKADLDGQRTEINGRFAATDASRERLGAEIRRAMREGFAAADVSRERLGTEIRKEMSERFAAADESQRELRAEMNERFATAEESQRQLQAEMNTRFAALEASQRQLIGMVSKALAEKEAAAWTHRKITVGIWVAVGAGVSLLVLGTLLRPLLERVAAALFGG